jgi:hypothetical protein
MKKGHKNWLRSALMEATHKEVDQYFLNFEITFIQLVMFKNLTN